MADNYKVINKELAQRNIELRHEIILLQNEICELKRILCEDRQQQKLVLKNSIKHLKMSFDQLFQVCLGEEGESKTVSYLRRSINENLDNQLEKSCTKIEGRSSLETPAPFDHFVQIRRHRNKSLITTSSPLSDITNSDVSRSETHSPSEENTTIQQPNGSLLLACSAIPEESPTMIRQLNLSAEQSIHPSLFSSEDSLAGNDENETFNSNDCSFNSSEAVSSTPYKPKKMRLSKVMIKRLKESDFVSFSVKNPPQTSTSSCTTQSNESSRPRRKVTPTNFTEPSLGKKLRRKI